MRNIIVTCPRCGSAAGDNPGDVVVCTSCEYSIATRAEIRLATLLCRETPPPARSADDYNSDPVDGDARPATGGMGDS